MLVSTLVLPVPRRARISETGHWPVFFWKSRMAMNSAEWTRRRFRRPHKMEKMEISLKNRQARAVINI
jgi:hypothetical protein